MIQSNYNSGGIPPGLRAAFSVEPMPDGALRIIKSGKAHRHRLGCSFVWLLACSALAAYMVYDISLWALLPSLDLLDVTVLRWLFTAALVVISLWSAMDLFWRLLGKEEWHIRPNCFEWHGNVLGIRWVRRYQGSKVWLRFVDRTGDDEEGEATKRPTPSPPSRASVEGYILIAKRDSKFWHQRYLHQSANLPELLALGELLAQRLGWPLQQDPDFVRRCAEQAAVPAPLKPVG